MPRPPRFPFFPHLAVIATVSLCGWLAGDSTAGPYLNSAHGNTTTGVRRASLPGTYSRGNCAHCHEQHNSIGGSEPAPVKLPTTAPSSKLLLDELDNVGGNAACDYCHNGSPGVDNIASQIGKTYHHDPYSAFGTVNCDDCHDSHVAQKVNHVEANDGNTLPAGSPLLSVAGTSVSNWTAGAPAPGAENLGVLTLNALAEPITYEYELCFKCHAGQLVPGLPRLNVALQFNPNNYSVHPVATETNPTWKNGWLTGAGFPTALNGNWATNPMNTEMYCSDCHGSETVGNPEGPHGSTQTYMLKYPGPGASLDNLCLHCHNPLVSAWVEGPGNPNAGMIGDHNLAQHKYNVVTNPLGCMACHGGIGGGLASNIHGANYWWPAGGGIGRQSKAFLVGGNITQNYYIGADLPGQRWCAATCHTVWPAYSY